MRCSICREEIHSAEVAFAQHAGCCTSERKPLGYRVVRYESRTGAREYWGGTGWVTDPPPPRSREWANRGIVVRVYLRIVRKRKGGAK